jgi:hypothetical protein
MRKEYCHLNTFLLQYYESIICLFVEVRIFLAYLSHIPGELDHLLYKVPMLSKGNLQAKQQEKYKHKEKFTENAKQQRYTMDGNVPKKFSI